mmetsp:Transcript_1343/g.1595  ORF Transcript_1343/g.1595 Transcript_1343/m.1595 type:complete len:82 (+) Transcript_1343:234-479(+)
MFLLIINKYLLTFVLLAWFVRSFMLDVIIDNIIKMLSCQDVGFPFNSLWQFDDFDRKFNNSYTRTNHTMDEHTIKSFVREQ